MLRSPSRPSLIPLIPPNTVSLALVKSLRTAPSSPSPVMFWNASQPRLRRLRPVRLASRQRVLPDFQILPKKDLILPFFPLKYSSSFSGSTVLVATPWMASMISSTRGSTFINFNWANISAMYCSGVSLVEPSASLALLADGSSTLRLTISMALTIVSRRVGSTPQKAWRIPSFITCASIRPWLPGLLRRPPPPPPRGPGPLGG